MIKLTLLGLALSTLINLTAQARTACDLKPESLKRLGIHLAHCEKILEGTSLGEAKLVFGNNGEANNDLGSLKQAADDIHGFTLEKLWIQRAHGPAAPAPQALDPLPASIAPNELVLSGLNDSLFPKGLFDGPLPAVKNLIFESCHQLQATLPLLAKQLINLDYLYVWSLETYCTPLDIFPSLTQLKIKAKQLTCGLHFLGKNTHLRKIQIETDDTIEMEIGDLLSSNHSLQSLSIQGVINLNLGQNTFENLAEIRLPGYSSTPLPSGWKKFAPHLKVFDISYAGILKDNPLDSSEFPSSLEQFIAPATGITAWSSARAYPNLRVVDFSSNEITSISGSPCLLNPQLQRVILFDTKINGLEPEFFKGCISGQAFNLGSTSLNLNGNTLADIIRAKSKLNLTFDQDTPLRIADKVFPFINWLNFFQGMDIEFAEEVEISKGTVTGPLCDGSQQLSENGYQSFSLSHAGLSEFPKCLRGEKISNTLDLSRNQIRSLAPGEMAGLRAARINLMGNPIENISARAFKGLINLQWLAITLMKNTDASSFDFPDSLNLSKITFSVPDGFTLDPKIFTRMNHGVTLEVHGGNIADAKVRGALKSLNLDYFQIP